MTQVRPNYPTFMATVDYLASVLRCCGTRLLFSIYPDRVPLTSQEHIRLSEEGRIRRASNKPYLAITSRPLYPASMCTVAAKTGIAERNKVS